MIRLIKDEATTGVKATHALEHRGNATGVIQVSTTTGPYEVLVQGRVHPDLLWSDLRTLTDEDEDEVYEIVLPRYMRVVVIALTAPLSVYVQE